MQQHSKLSGQASGITPVYIDVNKGEVIWVDSPDIRAKGASNLSWTLRDTDMIFERYCHGDRPSMGLVAERVAEHQGLSIVNSREEADIIVAMRKSESDREDQTVITPKERDIWIGSFMTPAREEDEKEVEKDNDLQKDVPMIEDIYEEKPEPIAADYLEQFF